MNPFIKVLLAVAAVAVVLLVTVAVWVALIFEPNDFRPMLVSAVERNTGRSFEIDGDLGLSVFPCCSVTVGPSTLGNPDGFPDQHFARLNEAALSLQVWPLLTRREVRIGTVTVAGLDLSLVRLADGRVNWEFGDAGPHPAEPGPSTGAPDDLSIAGLRISSARVAYRDLQEDRAFTATGVNAHAGTIGLAAPFPFEASATVTDSSDGTEARLNARGTLAVTEEDLLWRDPLLEIVASGPAVPARSAEARVEGVLLRIIFGQASEIAADRLAIRFDIKEPTALDALAGQSTDLSGRADLESLRIDLDPMSGRVVALTFVAQAQEARVNGTASGAFGSTVVGDAGLRGAFELEEAAPRRLLAALGAGDYRPARPDALQRLSGRGKWALTDNSVRLSELDIRLDKSSLTGTATLGDFGAGALGFDLALDQIDMDRYAPAPAVATPGDRNAAPPRSAPTVIPLGDLAGVELDGRIRIEQLRAAGLALSDVQMNARSRDRATTLSLQGQATNGSFRLEGRGDLTATDPQLNGSMTLQNVSPRALLTALGSPPDTRDPNVLSLLSGNADWSLAARSAGLRNIDWRLDDTRVTGSLRIDDFDRLATSFDLALDSLDVDRYLAPVQADAPAGPAAAIPVEWIRDLKLDGRLSARELTIAKVPLRDVSLEARGADGVLRLDPLRAGLFDGSYEGAITVDATGPQADVTVDQQLRSVQIGELLSSFYPTDRINGALSISLSGHGSGATLPDLLRGLVADFSLDLSDGRYRGVDLLHEIQQARAALRSERLPAAPEERITLLRALSLSGRMIDGVLRSDGLRAETDALRLTGSGGLNVLDFTLDYQLMAQVLKEAAGLSDLVGVTLPLTVQGPLMSPRVGVDLAGAATSAVRERVEDRAREALLRRLGRERDATLPTAAPDAEAEPRAADPAPAEEEPAAPEPAASPDQQAPANEDSPRDLLRRGLRDLIKPPQ